MTFDKDPIGYAIIDFAENESSEQIIVQSDLCEDDILPVPYLFREYDDMPELEKKALDLCEGKVLDVGAAGGCHSFFLHKKGLDVTAIDTSTGAVSFLQRAGLKAENKNFFECNNSFDTILILMNGIGIAGKLETLPDFLRQIKANLAPNGKALCDSTDLTYLYEEEDGSMWVDLNGSYMGEMQFKMSYKDVSSDWFNWLYIDYDLLKSYAEKEGLFCELLYTGDSNNYLVSLKHL